MLMTLCVLEITPDGYEKVEDEVAVRNFRRMCVSRDAVNCSTKPFNC